MPSATAAPVLILPPDIDIDVELCVITSGVAATPEAQEAFDRDELGKPPSTSPDETAAGQ